MSVNLCPKCKQNSLEKSYNKTLELCDSCLNEEYNQLLNNPEIQKSISYEGKGDLVKTKELLESMTIQYKKKQQDLLEDTTQLKNEISQLNDRIWSVPISYENVEDMMIAMEKWKNIKYKIIWIIIAIEVSSFLFYQIWKN